MRITDDTILAYNTPNYIARSLFNSKKTLKASPEFFTCESYMKIEVNF